MIAGAGLPAPQFLAYLSGAFEVLSGLAVLIGFQTKIVSYLLAAFCVFTGLVFHHGAINMPNFSPEANGMLTVFNQIMMMKDLAMAGGFLALAVAGAGALSVDGRRGA
jgi:putative oxidoreductase